LPIETRASSTCSWGADSSIPAEFLIGWSAQNLAQARDVTRLLSGSALRRISIHQICSANAGRSAF
jgi:hypothetical protein